MASEQTFQDRVQKGRELSAAVKLFDPAYVPADAQFTFAELDISVTVAETANAWVETQRIPFADATGDRVALLKTVPPLITQALAYVKSNTTWANRHDALKAAADKVRGVRAPVAKPADPDPDAKKRETGERSYVEIAGFLKSYIDRLGALVGYAPPDSKIALAALTTLWTDLDGFNKSIPGYAGALADAISDRQLTFTGPTALKFVFDGVKVSVKGQYGQSSPQHQAISGMSW